MGNIKVLFDTNVLIDYLSGVEAARTEIDRYSNRGISVITWMEVMVGVRPAYEIKTRGFLDTFQNIPITAAIAEGAVRVRKLRRLKLPDAIILATATFHNRLLITRSNKDFPADDPAIRVPYQL